MTTKPNTPNKQENTRKNKRDWSFYTIIVCLIVLAIPASFFLYLGFDALTSGNKPVLGDRFDGQIDNVITKEKQDAIKAALLESEGVESVEMTLITATLRIAIVTSPESSEENITAISAKAYSVVSDHLPIADYFTETSESTRYDLEIAVHNGLFDDKENFKLQMGTKNSRMESIEYTFVTTPYSQEWVDELWRRQEAKDEAAEKRKEEAANPEETPENEEEKPAE